MMFEAKVYIEDMHEMSFFIAQLNNHGISPSIHGRNVTITLEDECLELIQMIISSYDSLKDEDGRNEFSFKLSDSPKDRRLKKPFI